MLDHADGATLEEVIDCTTLGGTVVNTDEWKWYNGLPRVGRVHMTVNHSGPKSDWARDEDGDGVREVHCNTQEGIWTHVRNFLRRFYGVSKWYLAQYQAVFQWGYNIKFVTDELPRILLGIPPKHGFGPMSQPVHSQLCPGRPPFAGTRCRQNASRFPSILPVKKQGDWWAAANARTFGTSSTRAIKGVLRHDLAQRRAAMRADQSILVQQHRAKEGRHRRAGRRTHSAQRPGHLPPDVLILIPKHSMSAGTAELAAEPIWPSAQAASHRTSSS